LLIPGQSPGIKERLVDLYNKPEILFFGPDGAHTLFGFNIRTFTYMLFSRGNCRHDGLGGTYVPYFVHTGYIRHIHIFGYIVHARNRGADTWWKSFTTGKTAATLGGIPHDTYGMTSISIRQYVLGVYKQLGLREKDITKVQTGGPDGDLGSSTFSPGIM
jgi:glutamate dehydrogenase